jgi:hypothetical protein
MNKKETLISPTEENRIQQLNGLKLEKALGLSTIQSRFINKIRAFFQASTIKSLSEERRNRMHIALQIMESKNQKFEYEGFQRDQLIYAIGSTLPKERELRELAAKVKAGAFQHSVKDVDTPPSKPAPKKSSSPAQVSSKRASFKAVKSIAKLQAPPKPITSAPKRPVKDIDTPPSRPAPRKPSSPAQASSKRASKVLESRKSAKQNEISKK